jgi:hypothetical protein
MILSLLYILNFNISKGIGNIYIRGCIVCPNGKILVELMFIISIPLFVDTTTVASSRHVTSKGLPSEQIITLSNVPSSLRITSLLFI